MSSDTQASTSQMSGEKGQRKTGKRPGRKPVKIDHKAKLERSRQSARECRARKKLRYQYIEELVANREKAVFALREELQTCRQWCREVDSGQVSPSLREKLLSCSEDDTEEEMTSDTEDT
ncbi:hypothetical protein SNE40_021562 [Patella caerulea]|uniref:BZIP domain-containing protein n=1 Tax=Patella caerulea TaxID=87958 RepID=A0AAN8IXP5_PATCE